MPVILKNKQQIALLRESGRLVAQAFELLRPHVKPGVSLLELDRIAEEFIRSRGAEPVYKGYGGRGQPPFPGTICASVNDVICHGIPSERRLEEGDIIGVDIGVRLNGWVGDACVTYPVGEVDDESARLLEVTRQALELAIDQARVGKRLGDIGHAIQSYVDSQGFAVVREYTGHGLGRNLHEEPTVLHHGRPGTGMPLRPGMVFTIEPMVNAGRPGTRQLDDGWTVKTLDGSRSAQFEHTIVITDAGPERLTLP
jgi:methionyl aminopeptidase